MSTEAYKKRKRDWAKTESQKEYRKNYMRKWRSVNREHANKLALESHNRNKYKHIGKARIYWLMSQYGLTQEDYNELLLKQGNRCYICGKLHIDTKKGLHVDHCHVSGKIRGLLCSNCNGSLGWLEMNKDKLKEYIIKNDIVY